MWEPEPLLVRLAPLTAIAWVCLAPVALAHPRVEEGRQRLDEADFEGAMQAFSQAEREGGMTAADVARLLEGRAMVHLALGQRDGMDTALRRLASLDPDHEFAPGVRPEIRARFEALGDAERLALDVDAEPGDGGLVVRAEIRHDPAGLVEEVAVGGRTASAGEQSGAGGEVLLRALSGETVEYWVRALGPGGAIVAEAGTPDTPLSARMPGDASLEVAGPGDGDGDRPPWLIIGAAAGGALVVAVVIAILVASSGGSSDRTQPTAPVFEGL